MADLSGNFEGRDAYLLSEKDKRWFEELVAREVRKIVNVPNRPNVPQAIPQAPEVYIARTPTAGIDGMVRGASGETGTGTGTGQEEELVYYADLDIYRLLPQGKIGALESMLFQKRVYNISQQKLPGDTYIEAKRDKLGTWIGSLTASPGVNCEPVSFVQEKLECEAGNLNRYVRQLVLDVVEGCLTMDSTPYLFAGRVGCCECDTPGTATIPEFCDNDDLPESVCVTLTLASVADWPDNANGDCACIDGRSFTLSRSARTGGLEYFETGAPGCPNIFEPEPLRLEITCNGPNTPRYSYALTVTSGGSRQAFIVIPPGNVPLNITGQVLVPIQPWQCAGGPSPLLYDFTITRFCPPNTGTGSGTSTFAEAAWYCMLAPTVGTGTGPTFISDDCCSSVSSHLSCVITNTNPTDGTVGTVGVNLSYNSSLNEWRGSSPWGTTGRTVNVSFSATTGCISGYQAIITFSDFCGVFSAANLATCGPPFEWSQTVTAEGSCSLDTGNQMTIAVQSGGATTGTGTAQLSECLYLSAEEKADYIAAGWTESSGPHASEEACTASCGVETVDVGCCSAVPTTLTLTVTAVTNGFCACLLGATCQLTFFDSPPRWEGTLVACTLSMPVTLKCDGGDPSSGTLPTGFRLEITSAVVSSGYAISGTCSPFELTYDESSIGFIAADTCVTITFTIIIN